MFRFFRNIRQKLLEQDNVRKYILYAVGEIALVMIGILLALQVNNWNEEKKTDTLKENILIKIKADLTSDLKNIQKVRDDLNQKYEEGEYLLKFLDSNASIKEYDEEKLNRAFLQSSTAEEFNPISLSYAELVSTGLVNRIRKDSLKIVLFEYYENSIRDEAIIAQRNEYSSDYANARFNYLPTGVFIEKNKSTLKVGDFVENPYIIFELDWNEIREDGKMVVLLDKLLGTFIGQYFIINENEKEIFLSLDFIDEEIGTSF